MAALILSATSAARADNGVPRPTKVVIAIEENHAFSEIIGSASALYINSLANSGALMTNSFAITHPSQPNYVALFSGSTQGVNSDSMFPHSQFTAPNLAANLIAAGFTFGGYSETMPSVGYDGVSAGTGPATYQRKHNPWVNWQDATVPLPVNKLPASVNMPYAGFFPSDYSTLPALSFVIPNQLNDMHDGTVAQGNAWLQSNLSAYASWCQLNNSLLIVTWDEDDASEGNRITTIFYGPMVITGQYAETMTHYRLLRTLEDMYGLPHAANTVAETPIIDIWGSPSPANNSCANATIVVAGSYAFTTVGATTDGPDESGNCMSGGSGQITNDIWYRYASQCTGVATISLCGANFNSRLAAYGTACPAGSGTTLACNDDFCGDASRVTFPVVSGHVYRVRIGGTHGATGTGTMVITCGPPPPPACPADIDGNGFVNVDDLLTVINAWGRCRPAPALCPADIAPPGVPAGNGFVNVDDLLVVINSWGPCLP